MQEPITNILIIMAITPGAGSIVRILFEWEKKSLTIQRALFIIIAAYVVAYLFYLANDHKKIIPVEYIGFPSIISGIIAMEIIKIFIEDIPSMIREFIKKKVEK